MKNHINLHTFSSFFFLLSFSVANTKTLITIGDFMYMYTTHISHVCACVCCMQREKKSIFIFYEKRSLHDVVLHYRMFI